MKLKKGKKSLKNDKPVIYYTNNRLVEKNVEICYEIM